MMRPMPWMAEPIVRQLLEKLLHMVARQQAQERVRPPGMRITPHTLPSLFTAEEPGEAENGWKLIEKLAGLGWITIDAAKPVSGKAVYELRPYVRLVPAMEGIIRKTAGIYTRSSYTSEWHKALHARSDVENDLLIYLKRRPLRIGMRNASDVIERLLNIRSVAHEPLFLREVSGRFFWGDTKVLDRRTGLVAHVLGVPECPFPELPISVLCYCPFEEVAGILFVENEASFLSPRVRELARRSSLAMFLASGFKLAAARIRDPIGSNLFAQTPITGDGGVTCNRLQAWLHGCGPNWPILYWGDLDFAGMGILKCLRQGFPEMIAWSEAYDPLVIRVRAGDGFHWDESNVKRQNDPGVTGCAYADTVLLPAIRNTGLFCHQEN